MIACDVIAVSVSWKAVEKVFAPPTSDCNGVPMAEKNDVLATSSKCAEVNGSTEPAESCPESSEEASELSSCLGNIGDACIVSAVKRRRVCKERMVNMINE